MMTSEITTGEPTFEEKMKERIRSSIGDLMSDADLAKIIEKGIDEAFFKPKPNPRYHNANHWERNNIPLQLPPMVETILTSCITERVEKLVKAEVDKWILENHDKVSTVIKEVVDAGAGDMLVRHLARTFSDPITHLGIGLEQTLQQLRNKGLVV
jgi:hypothetical protein